MTMVTLTMATTTIMMMMNMATVTTTMTMRAIMRKWAKHRQRPTLYGLPMLAPTANQGRSYLACS